MNREDESPGRETLAVAAIATAASFSAFQYFAHTRQLLLYGDAVAHLNIARRVVDSLTPGPLQLGSVWLPFPHLLMLPFVLSDGLWRGGTAGSIPSMIFYVLAVVGIYRLVRLFAVKLWAGIGAFLFGANPNMLYMQCTAMTEPVYIALFIWVVYFLTRAAVERPRNADDGAAALNRCAMVLAFAIMTRYDGWVLAAVVLAGAAGLAFDSMRPSREMHHAFYRVALLIVLVPALWIAYNARVFGDPWDFVRGPYSARAIEQRTQSPGAPHHPGYHNLRVASQYFLKSAKANVSSGRAGNWFLGFALLGTVATFAFKRNAWPLWLLWLPIPFYAGSIAYGAVPIFVPTWWPFSWYNVRYGLELLPAFAVFVGLAGSLLLPERRRITLAAAILLIVFIGASYASVWARVPITLQEARVNARNRLRYENDVAALLRSLPPDAKLMMYLSDHVGAAQSAGIHFKRIVNEGNYVIWQRALVDPQSEGVEYLLAASGDPVDRAMRTTMDQNLCFEPVNLSAINDSGEPQTFLYRLGNRTKQQGCAPAR